MQYRELGRTGWQVSTISFGAWAMFGAVAAGRAAGGYDSIFEATPRMAHLKRESFKPLAAHQRTYDALYTEYARLYDYFGRGDPQGNVMKTLKRIKVETLRS